jgi:ADP-ribosylglycohydrolase
MRIEDRVVACFRGLAAGDAIGKQSETLSTAAVRQWYPLGIRGFEGRPGDVIPRYAGKRYEWRIGETTDDTEQTLAVSRAILSEGKIRREAIGRELLRCRKSAHPGVSLWDFQQAGDPARIATDGDGCGAAMRSAPAGVLYPTSRLRELMDGAYQIAIPTHGGAHAIAAAGAVACAISAALEGRPAAEVLATAVQASGLNAIEEIYCNLATGKWPSTDQPARGRTIVPLAIAMALATGSAEETALRAANLGGDADSVASIGGAVAGALWPETVNLGWCEVVRAINPDDIVGTALSLAAMRA